MTAVKYDVDQYQSIVGRATFNCEFWRGTIQDLSYNRLTMTSTGRLTRYGSYQKFSGGQAASTTNPGSLVDLTGTFSVELLSQPPTSVIGSATFQQTSAVGGFYFYNHSIGWYGLYLLNAAGALAVTLTTNAGTLEWGKKKHIILTSVSGGASGLGWINGQPVAVTRTLLAGPAANVVTAQVVHTESVTAWNSISRAYPLAMNNDDAGVLYAAAQNLCSG